MKKLQYIHDTILKKKLQTDWKAITVIIVSTLILTVRFYNQFTGNIYLDGILLYLVLPLAIIVAGFRENPRRYGFGLGDWRTGIKLTLLCSAVMTAVLFVVARTPDFQAYYGSWYGNLAETIGYTAADLFGWEFFFRGFLLFGLARIAGSYAVWLQAVPFTIAHFGKPQLETISCIFGGAVFGWIAWRTRSFLYPFLIHWYIGVMTVLFAKGAI